MCQMYNASRRIKWNTSTAVSGALVVTVFLVLCGMTATAAPPAIGESEKTLLSPVKPRSKPPVVLWDAARKEYKNPRTGGDCRETPESCLSCPAGTVQETYRKQNHAGRLIYAYFCCDSGAFAAVDRAAGVGNYPVCLDCPAGTVRGQPKTDLGRYHGFDCFRCNRAGYAWYFYNGEQTCLSCGADYVFSERSRTCVLEDKGELRIQPVPR